MWVLMREGEEIFLLFRIFLNFFRLLVGRGYIGWRVMDGEVFVSFIYDCIFYFKGLIGFFILYFLGC